MSSAGPVAPEPDAEALRADHWIAVKSFRSSGPTKHLSLEDGRTLRVHRFALVGKGDSVRGSLEDGLSVATRSGEVLLHPPFRHAHSLELAPGVHASVDVREIVSDDDFQAYRALSEFHYRSDDSFGRRAVLLMTSAGSLLPHTVGFIELTTAFLNLKNRNDLFDSPFSEVSHGISWDAWDVAARSAYTNVIVRISRMVIHPEVRGLGLTTPLIRSAVEFCRTRWHLARRRPLFLEITADMLKFMPFVQAAGMRYIGESPGNEKRLVKDMQYLYRTGQALQDAAIPPSEVRHSVLGGRGKGILQRQRRDLERIIDLHARLGPQIPFEQFIAELVDDIDLPDVYEVLLPFVRFPKPTYMLGLTRRADAFVRSRATQLGVTAEPLNIPSSAAASEPFSIDGLSLRYSIDTGSFDHESSREIRRAFGLDKQFHFATGITDLTFAVQPGEVCYIYGASGSGKTSLLRLLENAGEDPAPAVVTGRIVRPRDARVGKLAEEFPLGALVDAVGAKSLRQAINALNTAGLAEPRLYLSHFGQLSAGQQYRAHLARLLCSDANVWILDEFTSSLDDATGLAVARNFAKAARRRGIICFVAGVRRSPLINALAPDVLVQLDQLRSPKVTRDWLRLSAGDAV